MPRKPKTPQSLLAAVDAYEASAKSNQSNSARVCETEAKPAPNPMRQVVKEANKAAWAEVDAQRVFDEKAAEIKANLADLLEAESHAGLLHAATVRDTAGYGEAISAVSRNIVSMRLLREQSTSNPTPTSPADAKQTMSTVMLEAVALYEALTDDEKAELARRAQPVMESAFLPEKRADVRTPEAALRAALEQVKP